MEYQHVRSIIAILLIALERVRSTAPKIVRWEFVSILSENFSGRGPLQEDTSHQIMCLENVVICVVHIE